MNVYIRIIHPYYFSPLTPVSLESIQDALEIIMEDERVPPKAKIRIWMSEEDAWTNARPLLEVTKDEDFEGFLAVQPPLGIGILPAIQQWMLNKGFLTSVMARHQSSSDDEGEEQHPEGD